MNTGLDIDEQIKIIRKGAAEIISEPELRAKLLKSQQSGKPLVVKLGLDPTAPDIHIGHAVVLRKLKAFQDMGHQVVIVIGDFTGMVGDPTGKSETRKQLSREEVTANAATYIAQLGRILDIKRTVVRFNSEWLSPLNFNEVIQLCARYTVARMLEREDFKHRYTNNLPIFIHEFFYPLMQGYDSIAIHADVELGGTDQKFNILMGRTLQKEYGQSDVQIALFMPLLEGTDGVNKMSKSLHNYIGIDEKPGEIYGKTMSIPDSMIIRYFELATDEHPDAIGRMKEQLQSGSVNPRDLKMRLAHQITRLYHGSEAAGRAQDEFVSFFQKGTLPGEIEEYIVAASVLKEEKTPLLAVIVQAGLAPSSSEARRLVQQGAVKINEEKVTTFAEAAPADGDVIRVGKRRLIRLRIEAEN